MTMNHLLGSYEILQPIIFLVFFLGHVSNCCYIDKITNSKIQPLKVIVNFIVVFKKFNSLEGTLPAEMFGVSVYWQETRLIIKISTHPC